MSKFNSDEIIGVGETLPEIGDAEDPISQSIYLRNIGGLDTVDLNIPPGITVLVGENATNRSSTLRGIAAALGAEINPEGLLRSDADEGYVAVAPAAAAFDGNLDEVEPPVWGTTFERESRTQVRQHRRSPDHIDSWTRAVMTNFVALFEDNPIRSAISRGETDDLCQYLMDPVDTETLERKIRQLKAERDDVSNQIKRLECERDRLPSLESDLQNVVESIQETEHKLERARQRVDEAEADVEEVEQAEQLVSQLESTNEALQSRRDELKREQKAIASLKEEREDLETKLDEFEFPDIAADDIEQQLVALEARRGEINDTVSELRRVLRFNRKMVETDDHEMFAATDDSDVTAALNPAEREMNCWTCGTTVEKTAIRDRLSDLEQLVEQKEAELDSIEDEINELRTKQSRLDEARSERENLENQLTTTKRELERRQTKVKDLEATIDDLEAEVGELQHDVAETRQSRGSELLDAYQRVAELNTEFEQYKQQREELKTEIEAIDGEINQLDQLRKRQEEISEQIKDLRSRVTTLEQEVVEQFNQEMEAVLDILGYENLSRVWIERKVTDDETKFDLHIIRDAGYEDSIKTLSESEREVIGLMIAVAGYLAHDVAEAIPILLLDSLEAIDATRIRTLMTYLAEETGVEYMVMALLSEDAAEMPDSVIRLDAREHLGAD